MSKESRYTVVPSNAFIFQWLIITFIINLVIYLIIYFIVNPYIQASLNPDRTSRIVWAIFIVIAFLVFAITYIIINSYRYWIDSTYLEIRNNLRTKKKRIVHYEKVNYLKVNRMPIFGTSFNYGTIILYNISTEGKREKKKVVGRLLGVKHPEDIVADLKEIL
jgi:uncharacterized membrane protein YdbT with pleckstrin-like domain